MRRASILLYSDSTTYGGAEKYLVTLAAGLDRKRFEPAIVAADDPGADRLAREAAALHVDVYRLPALRHLGERRKWLRILWHFLVHRRRIVHFNLVESRSCGGAVLAAWLAGHRRLVATDQLPGGPAGPPPPFRERFAVRHLRRVIAVSEAGVPLIAARGVDPSRITVIRNAVDAGAAPGEAERDGARKALGLDDHVPAIGIVGRLVAQKGQGLFLDAAAEIARAEPRARFYLVGDGPQRTALVLRRDALGLEDRAVFLGQRDDVPALLPGFDVVVSCSGYEGLPFAVLEALAAGRAVVAPDIPGIGEILEDGRSGAVVPPGDAAAVAGAVLRLLGDRDLRARLGAAGRKVVETRFAADAMVRATEDVYTRCLGR